ncbi:MAG: hypothetical protein IPJ17_12045 [Holophagales bacterium]|nr:MAG: hypothetical protein IPJ17_12045 [Holophagales bacterium]
MPRPSRIALAVPIPSCGGWAARAPRRCLLALITLLAGVAVPLLAQEGELDTTFQSAGLYHHHPDNVSDPVRVLAAPDGALVFVAHAFFPGDVGGNDFWKRIADHAAGADCFVTGTDIPSFFVADARFDRLGRLLLVGSDPDNDRIVVFRYSYPTCDRDDSFGTNGVAVFSSSSWSEERGVAILERRYGTLFPSYAYFVLAENGGTLTAPRGAVLLKLDEVGDLWSGWGNGLGWINHSFLPDVTRPIGLELDGAARLVIGLEALRSGSSGHDFAAARVIATDGALDPAFSSDGYVRIPIDADGANSDDLPLGLATGTDSRVALVGKAPDGSGIPRPTLVVLTSAGALDSSFAGDGKRQLPGQGQAWGARLLADGKMVVVGQGVDLLFRDESRIRRLLASGADDPDFGVSGSAVFDPLDFGNGDDGARSVVVVGGKVVVAGWGEETPGHRNAYLMRFTSSTPASLLPFVDGFESGDLGAWD